jgi:TusE/DsrC/DsvC family sulfur relay protein
MGFEVKSIVFFRKEENRMGKIAAPNQVIPAQPPEFVNYFEDWDETYARKYAATLGVNLKEDHWAILYFLRQYYRRNRIAPMFKVIHRECGINQNRLCQLFQVQDAREICRIAGLPYAIGMV